MKEYGKSYFKTLLKVLSVAGAPFLVISAISNPFALYFVFCSVLVASAGPISLMIGKSDKREERRAS